MSETIKKYKIQQKDANGNLITLYPKTEASIVVTSDIRNSTNDVVYPASNVQTILTQLATDVQAAVGGGITGAKIINRAGDTIDASVVSNKVIIDIENLTSDVATLEDISNSVGPVYDVINTVKDNLNTVQSTVNAVYDNLNTVSDIVNVVNTTANSAYNAANNAKDLANNAQSAIDALNNMRGAINGIAQLDGEGKVPAAQLPSYVDDVVEYDKKDDFPAEGESGKIYIATNTNRTYRWSGTQYAEIKGDLALGETATTAYAGDKGKKNADDIANITSDLSNLDSRVGTVESSLNPMNNATTHALQTAENAQNAADEAKSAIDALNTDSIIIGENKFVTASQLEAIDTIATVSSTANNALNATVTNAQAISDINNKFNGAVDTGNAQNHIYSVVQTNQYGVVTAGGNLIEIGSKDEGQTNTPSELLVYGGIFFKEI